RRIRRRDRSFDAESGSGSLDVRPTGDAASPRQRGSGARRMLQGAVQCGPHERPDEAMYCASCHVDDGRRRKVVA
ncbi:MAG: hypothetical protein Q8K82_05330, partial [Gemmatimonadaceae bacterium]|nr:hypothetical protein [Gemmatimonadaceae bacterium]